MENRDDREKDDSSAKVRIIGRQLTEIVHDGVHGFPNCVLKD